MGVACPLRATCHQLLSSNKALVRNRPLMFGVSQARNQPTIRAKPEKNAAFVIPKMSRVNSDQSREQVGELWWAT